MWPRDGNTSILFLSRVRWLHSRIHQILADPEKSKWEGGGGGWGVCSGGPLFEENAFVGSLGRDGVVGGGSVREKIITRPGAASNLVDTTRKNSPRGFCRTFS